MSTQSESFSLLPIVFNYQMQSCTFTVYSYLLDQFELSLNVWFGSVIVGCRRSNKTRWSAGAFNSGFGDISLGWCLFDGKLEKETILGDGWYNILTILF